MLVFPSTPLPDELFPDPPIPGIPRWRWDGVKWVAVGASSDLATQEWVREQIVPFEQAGGFLNKLRNGTMDVWQRGTAIVVNPAINTYTADGWAIYATGAAVHVNRAASTTPRELTEYVMDVAPVASATAVVAQRIESVISASLGTHPTVFQAMIHNRGATAFTPRLRIQHATTRDNWTAAATIVLPFTPMQPCPPGQWTQVAYTFQLPFGIARFGIEVAIEIVGTNQFQIGELDLRIAPGVPIGLNDDPSTPEMRPIPSELLYCQRYYSWQRVNWQTYVAIAGIETSTSVYFSPMRIFPSISWVNELLNNVGSFNADALSVSSGRMVVYNPAIGGFGYQGIIHCHAEL